MRILVRSPNWIGDQVLAYPFFHFLRSAYRRAHITAVCVPWVESVQFRNLVDEVVVIPRPDRNTWSERLKVMEETSRRLRKSGKWDLAITLPDSLSSAWLIFRAGARRRRGYRGDGRSWLLTEKLDPPGQGHVHRADAYCHLLPEAARPRVQATEFWGVRAENELDPDIPGVIDRFDAEKAWPVAELAPQPAGEYWVLAPGSAAESRRWPLERFAQFARKVASETGLPGVVVGGPSEVRLATELCSDPSLKLTDLVGQGPVSCYSRIFRDAKFTLSNDSGLAHVASLCGSPVQVVWGAGDPKRTRPIGPGEAQIVFNPVECWPCERNVCMLGSGERGAPGARAGVEKLQCLTGIQAEQVWDELKRGLRH